MQFVIEKEIINYTNLEEFILSHKNRNFFHSPLSLELFSGLKNYSPIVICAQEGTILKGVLLAVIVRESKRLKGYFSKRCIVWGGPLTDDPKVVDGLLKKLDEFVRGKCVYTEFRNLFDIKDYSVVFQTNGYCYVNYINYIIKIFNIEHNKNLLSSTRRRQIKKGLNAGAIIREAASIEDVKSFYSLLDNLYKTKIKKPLPELDLFIRFFYLKSAGKYFLVEYKNQIIGGILCPIFLDTIYEWYVCGLDVEYKEFYPSVLATWAPIEYACANGLKYFDFMGAGVPDRDYGVREFKSKFGGTMVDYGRFIKVNKPFLYNFGKTALQIYQKTSR